MRVLVVEDDPSIRRYVAKGIREAGHAVDEVKTGEDALAAVAVVAYDGILLDISLPGVDGIEVCRLIRMMPDGGPPILMLTAHDTVKDRVLGLDAGAEDYLVKPFAFAELLARLRALLRRGRSTAPALVVDDLVLDPAGHHVTRGEDEVQLTPKEFALLEYLMRNVGQAVSKGMIAEHVWDFRLEAEGNFIEVFIYSLRKKLGLAAPGPIITTLRGVGYRLDVQR